MKVIAGVNVWVGGIEVWVGNSVTILVRVAVTMNIPVGVIVRVASVGVKVGV